VNVINISDYKNGQKPWEGKLSQGPTLFETEKLVSQREIDSSYGDVLGDVERSMIHELAEFLYENKICKITHEALPSLDPFQPKKSGGRKLRASIMIFKGAK